MLSSSLSLSETLFCHLWRNLQKCPFYDTRKKIAIENVWKSKKMAIQSESIIIEQSNIKNLLIYFLKSMITYQAVKKDVKTKIWNSQIKSPFLTGKLSFRTIFLMWISEFADKKSANNEGRLYHFLKCQQNLDSFFDIATVLSMNHMKDSL